MNPSLREFIFETPLYEQIAVTEDGAASVLLLFNKAKAKLVGFCTECQDRSIFHSDNYRNGANGVYDLDDVRGTRSIVLTCQQNHSHKLKIYTELLSDGDGYSLQKIGQLPSHADVANGGLSRFEKILEKIDRSELIRSHGLAAHGVNIGAFVYLRRVFERLIWRARDRITPNIDEDAFKKLRMNEKIEALKGVLPTFLADNSKIYSVLSKGIHELSEKECGKLYELMHKSIVLMLDQELEISKRVLAEKEMSALVSKIDLNE